MSFLLAVAIIECAVFLVGLYGLFRFRRPPTPQIVGPITRHRVFDDDGEMMIFEVIEFDGEIQAVRFGEEMSQIWQ